MHSTGPTFRKALAATTALLITACQSSSLNSITPPSTAAVVAPSNAIASIDGSGKCRFGKVHVFNGPSGSGGALQIVSDRAGNLWYGSIGINAIVKYVRRHGPAAYSISAPNAKPEGIALDPHGHVWFTEWNLPDIGRLAHGRVKQYNVSALNGSASNAIDMILGPDKRLWFTTDYNGIGAKSLHGGAVLYSLANNAEQPSKLAIGPDGNVWFTEFAGPNVGKITRSGAVTEYNVSGGQNSFGITAGPDGRIWFTDPQNHRIGAIDTDGTGLTYYSVGAGSPAEITGRKHDRNLYFTEWNGYVGQITTKGVVRLCAIPAASPTFVAFGITEDPVDHDMWFVDNSGVDRIGELAVR